MFNICIYDIVREWKIILWVPSQGFYCCDKTLGPKAAWRGRVYFILQLWDHTTSPRESEQELTARTWKKAMERCCSPACCSPLARPDFLYCQDHLPRSGITHSTGPSHINHQSKTSPTDKLNGGVLWRCFLNIPSSLICLDFCQGDRPNQHKPLGILWSHLHALGTP